MRCIQPRMFIIMTHMDILFLEQRRVPDVQGQQGCVSIYWEFRMNMLMRINGATSGAELM